MPAQLYSAATLGLTSSLVDVEVDVLTQSLHAFTIVGLPDTAIKESRDRVSSAIKNSDFTPPHHCGRITVNLAPADLPKTSPIYDVPIAIGTLLATQQLTCDVTKKLFVGELALSGIVRPIRGALPIALLAQERGFRELYVPHQNAREAAAVDGIIVYPLHSLTALAAHLAGEKKIRPLTHSSADTASAHENSFLTDMCDIKGQEHAKRALEIAAAGGHNVLFSGSPGSGKTLLAKAFSSILPALTRQEQLDITKIHSIAGILPREGTLVTRRPFRTPHHSASAVSLIGGGTLPKPGEISLAHHGVLFLDEFAEFPAQVLDNLRQPLEDGIVTVSRARGSASFPAHFILIGAMNPCPCGFRTDPERTCTCTSHIIDMYRSRISGPIRDRIDMHIDVPRLQIEKIEDRDEENPTSETSAIVRARTQAARTIQHQRFHTEDFFTNARMDVRHLKKFCVLDAATQQFLRSAATKLLLSARSYHRIIKIARTIADLAGEQNITQTHIAEALQYRAKEL